MTVLLSIKLQLHTFVQHLTREEIYAALKFAVITAIVFRSCPIARSVWRRSIYSIRSNCGCSWCSFPASASWDTFSSRWPPEKRHRPDGISRRSHLQHRSHGEPDAAQPRQCGTVQIVRVCDPVAWTVMFVRVLGVVAVLNVALVKLIVLPICASIVAGLAYCLYLYRPRGRKAGSTMSRLIIPSSSGSRSSSGSCSRSSSCFPGPCNCTSPFGRLPFQFSFRNGGRGRHLLLHG